jgi:hypothetical protein
VATGRRIVEVDQFVRAGANDGWLRHLWVVLWEMISNLDVFYLSVLLLETWILVQLDFAS